MLLLPQAEPPSKGMCQEGNKALTFTYRYTDTLCVVGIGWEGSIGSALVGLGGNWNRYCRQGGKHCAVALHDRAAFLGYE